MDGQKQNYSRSDGGRNRNQLVCVSECTAVAASVASVAAVASVVSVASVAAVAAVRRKRKLIRKFPKL